MECGSGHEAHRCIGSGFSWGSWLLGGRGGGGKSRAGEGGGPVAMAAGTAGAQPAGAQSAGTWSSGHGRGLTEGKGGAMKKLRLCPRGSTRKKVSRDRMGDVGARGGLRALLHPMQAARGAPLHRSPVGIPGSLPVPRASPWGPSGSIPSSPAEDPACCCCCFCSQGSSKIVNSGSVILTQSPGLPGSSCQGDGGSEGSAGRPLLQVRIPIVKAQE